MKKTCNRIMRPLKAYLEYGESNDNVTNLVAVLSQLTDDELAFVMTKYVALATYRDDGRQINQAPTAMLKERLKLSGKELNELEDSVYEKIYDMYFAGMIKKYRQDDAEFARKQAERKAEWERWKIENRLI